MPQSLFTRIAVFTALTLGLGTVAVLISHVLAGWPGVEGAVWAVAVCWIPGVIVLGVEPHFRSPTGQVATILLGTMLRVAAAAGGAVALIQLRPELPRGPFLGSVLVLYLASLAWETVVLAKAAPAGAPRQPVA